MQLLTLSVILVGNLWSQNWEALIDLVFSNYTAVMPNLTNSMIQKNYSVIKMVKTSEDFYISLGFPPLPSNFWKNSIFKRKKDGNSICHATAVNMYKKDDFRYFLSLELTESMLRVKINRAFILEFLRV